MKRKKRNGNKNNRVTSKTLNRSFSFLCRILMPLSPFARPFIAASKAEFRAAMIKSIGLSHILPTPKIQFAYMPCSRIEFHKQAWACQKVKRVLQLERGFGCGILTSG